MNNFFNSNSDFDLFKKALRSTKNEPVVINILSNDSSLNENGENGDIVNVERKQMSSKFQASPFDKFFGPRKKRTDPVDMKDFSSWRNKNYRESEKQINETPETEVKFSFGDYLNSRTKPEKFNDEDQLKADSQKPIDQISIHDDDYKKFSLDSYLTKLEQETKAKKDFAETEDLISADEETDLLVGQSQDQDENFMNSSDVNVEDVAFGGDDSGERFAFDKEELDSVKARLEKMEREASNGKDKPTTKVISSDEIKEMKGVDDENDEFNLDKLGIEDDIERVNQKIDSLNKVLNVTGDEETETPKVEHKRFFEINKNFDENDVKKQDETSDDEKDEETVKEETDKNETVETTEKSDGDAEEGVVKPEIIDGAVSKDDDLAESETNDENIVDVVEIPETEKEKADEESKTDEEEAPKSELNKTDEYLTKADFKDLTEKILDKFSELHREKSTNGEEGISGYDEFGNPYNSGMAGAQAGQGFVGQGQTAQGYAVQGQAGQGYAVQGQAGVANPYGQSGFGQQPGAQQSNSEQLYQQQNDLQTKIVELIEQNKKSDKDVAEKLQQAELEKQRVAEEYERRLRELEASMKKREEEVKQQAYIERLKNDIKFKKSETKHKLREEQIRENEKISSEHQLASEKLKSELKNNLNISNLEMDKKLLECVNKLHKVETPVEEVSEDVIEEPVDEIEETEKTEKTERVRRTRTPRTSSRRKTSTVKSRMRTRTPRRKIDSDIIGGINFD